MRETTEAAVLLEGSPTDVGARFGAVNAEDIAAAMESFFQTVQEKEGLSRAALVKASRRYQEQVESFAPHWLPEALALANAAGVDAELFLTFQGAKYRGINRPECFSYYSSPRFNTAPVTLLHKNRDNAARPQCAYRKHVAAPGVLAFLAGADTSDMGACMALNEEGLAIVADTGDPDPHFRQQGMMNTDVLRLIAERAADVTEALALLNEVHRARGYAGGRIGTNWMLADRHGRGARVFQFHEKLLTTEGEAGFLVMRDDDPRGKEVSEALTRARGRVDVALMNRLSRGKPVLAESNISSYTAVIPTAGTRLFAHAYFALGPACAAVYVPLYLGVTATPRPLLDGTLYRAATAREANAVEAAIEADRYCTEETARRVLQEEGEEAARRVLTEACLRWTTWALRFLQERKLPHDTAAAL
ncbi:MAG: carcinine hydrolase/isopenicillin-N N-acyltransferase family protein [Armatimonadota bacterium]|nr:carcinine hydrolase/isopenicillin-N N-acyltransferase family protein [Armatimonadota bacterium]